MEFAEDFETHLTVALDGLNQLERLRQWARGRELKVVHIVLERGAQVSQPMLTRRARCSTFSGELAAAQTLRNELATNDFAVVRTKIEIAAQNLCVPQTERDAAAANGYFEHHVKLRLQSNQDSIALRRLAEQHSAHLSRNAFKQSSADGFEERFVTQRCWRAGFGAAQQRFDALLDAIKNAGYPILKTEQEFVIYDDNLLIDAGWITT